MSMTHQTKMELKIEKFFLSFVPSKGPYTENVLNKTSDD